MGRPRKQSRPHPNRRSDPEYADEPRRRHKNRRDVPVTPARPDTPASPPTLRKLATFRPLTESQADLWSDLHDFRVTNATGPAGTGKTFVALSYALKLLQEGRIETLICLRPTVEAGSKLGYLPGDLREKIDPYFAPIRQNIGKALGSQSFAKGWMKAAEAHGSLLFTSIQHLRGTTLDRAFVLTDESQNCTYAELKLILTRMGEASRFCFAGDQTQYDLPEGESGYAEFTARIAPLTDMVGTTRFSDMDVVRDPLLAELMPHL